MVGLAEETAGTLLDGGDGRLFEGVGFKAGQVQVMDQISFHFLAGDAFEMTTGQDAGSQGMGSAEDELIDQGALTGQNDRKIRFGILIELGEGVKFGKDLQPQERGLIDNQDGFYFFGFIKGRGFPFG